MIALEHDDEFIHLVGQRFDVMVIRLARVDANIGRIFCHCLGRDCTVSLFQVKLYLGVLIGKPCKIGWQKLGDGRDVGKQPNLTAGAVCVVEHLGVKVVERVQRP